MNILVQQRLRGEPPNLRAALFTAADWLLYGAITPFVFLLARRFPLSGRRGTHHLLFHLGAALAFCAAWAGMGTVLKAILQPGALSAGAPRFFVGWFFTTLPFGVAIYLAVVGIEHAVHYFAQVSRLSEQLAGARLAALQAQLNPHFLFNSLNTAAVLVREGDRTSATRVIQQLSDLLRRTLNRRQVHEVPLDDELALVHQYLAVEQARFSDRLRPEFWIEAEARSALVPSFALQHLVQNAVRHGVAERIEAGHVMVTASRSDDVLELSVMDDGPGIAPGAEALPGHGLDETRQRLAALYGDRASLVLERLPAGTAARMRLPFRKATSTASGRAVHGRKGVFDV